MSPTEGSNVGSMATLVSLSHTTKRPEGQSPAWREVCWAAAAPSCFTKCHTSPLGSQNLAEAHRDGMSVKFHVGPRRTRASCKYGDRLAVSVPSKPTRACEPSQKGFVPDCPQRQRLYVALASNSSPASHSTESPSSATIVCRASGTEPSTT